jgi:hypothetical protein
MSMLTMLLNATRSACVVTVLVTAAAATGCGQDLDLGPITGRDGLTLPPTGAASGAGNGCPVETAAALGLPTRCHADNDIGWTQSDEGRFEYKFISESCLVDGNGVVPLQETTFEARHAACPIGVYWKFAPMPWRRNGPPMPADGTFPSAEAFERSIAVVRGDQPADILPGPEGWEPPYGGEGWQTVPRSVEVLPEQQAVFIRFDPRPSTGQRFVVFVSYPQLTPDSVQLGADPVSQFWALDILPGSAPVIE